MPTEVEAKFVAAGQQVLDALRAADSLGSASLGSAFSFDETDAYLDTVDRRLAAARWACRLRTRDGATIVSLKGPPRSPWPAPEWLHRRPEVEGPASAALDPETWPASAARALLLDLSGGAPLVELVRLRQTRTERPVMLDGHLLGTLSLDRVTLPGMGNVLLGVELELHGDDEASLGAVAAALAANPDLEPDPLTKLEHALAAIGEVG